MPAIAAIALLNGETTPVSHTFAPLGQDRSTGTWWFEDQSPRITATSPLGWPRIGITVKRNTAVNPGDSSANRVNKVEVSIALPFLETLGTSGSGLTPAPTIAYVERSKHEFFLSARDDLAMRKDILAYGKNVLANANVVDLVQNLTQFY